ncbi:MAG TPA: hypothetical protein H9932_09780 [Candidatus Brachybacterium intestinipullorum]|uniref:Uncharacterized protein n=1 Tax=Candidatus Brachybacterium intestinipullorum TaxID=2838512 RepID=A0A9D2Q0W2_9MICO|nr:hypothetical protein [Candidatus Brachybacterium intestinipullorum]
MNTTPPAVPDRAAPAPRRSRGGEVLVGPSVRARYLPGALIGLPLVALLLSPLAGAGLQQWRASRRSAGHDGALEQLLAPTWAQLLLGALALWALFALWALVPLLLTRTLVLLDEERRTLRLRKGLRIRDRGSVDEVEYAVGEAVRGSLGLIGVRTPGQAQPRQWVVPEIGWDDASFDGLRLLQAAAGFTPAPPRAELVAEHVRSRREAAHRELATRLGMPWREEYAQDDAAFRAEFDRVRRVLGGKEPPREGDPEP